MHAFASRDDFDPLAIPPAMGLPHEKDAREYKKGVPKRGPKQDMRGKVPEGWFKACCVRCMHERKGEEREREREHGHGQEKL